MSADEKEGPYFDCSFVSIHYIICECGETFPSENGLKAHLEKEHPHKRERKEFKCGVCGLVYQTEEECITHYEDSHIADIKTETPDDEEVQSEETLQQELVVTAGNGLNADIDEGQVIGEVGVEVGYDGTETQVLHIPEEYEQLLQVTPDGQLVLMMGELPKKSKPKRKNEGKKSAVIKKDIVCEVCGRKYASNAALRYHQRLHTGERPYHCHLCPKTFAMPLFLQIHIRTHTGERPYKCPDCPKAFSNKAALMRHERVHTGEKPYACPLCGKAFTQSNSMKLHVATVHLKQPAPYKSKSRKLKALAKMQEKRAQRVEAEEIETELVLDGAVEAEDAARAITAEGGRAGGDVFRVVYK